MTLLFLYLFIAIGVSFFCSIAEAVLLSVRPSYIAALQQNKRKSGNNLKKLQDNLDRALAAILTANTIAHTVGAAGVGAQATVVFGNGYLGITSAILTLLILVFSEIIPKTLGATYWKQLAPVMAILILWLTKLLSPFVWMTQKLTRLLSPSDTNIFTFSRDEMIAMAHIGKEEGLLDSKEHVIIANLMKLHRMSVRDIMTPSLVIFSIPQDMSVDEFFKTHTDCPFSRIPIFTKNIDDINGYVLKNDLLIAHASKNTSQRLEEFKRDIAVVSDAMMASDLFDLFIREKSHIVLVVDEFGATQGIVTLEDVVETLIGLEIVDESDTIEDMRVVAKKLWKERMKSFGINPESNSKS